MDEIRRFFGRLMAWASRSDDPRLAEVFARVPREAFLPPGPWQIRLHGDYLTTPDADPAYLYQNAVVALDAANGVNIGEPFLHAAWIGAVAPRPGEAVAHVGAGSGYYTAMLSLLVQPGGRVEAFEIDPARAAMARANLAAFDGVRVHHADATVAPVPPSDLIYVNAGVVAPPAAWLRALRTPAGRDSPTANARIILPWRPAEHIGLAIVTTRRGAGFAVAPLMAAWFIPCVGASSTDVCLRAPDRAEAWSARSAWLTADRIPDESAVAIYRDVWFSSLPLPAADAPGERRSA